MSTRSVYEMCRAYRESIGIDWFTGAWDLNLVISRDDVVGTWGDRAFFCTETETGRKVVQPVICTSDAWEGEWTDPTHPDGCLWIPNQHVPGGYELGTHNGREALRQRRAFLNVRWVPDGTIPTVAQLEALVAQGRHDFTAIRGTNFHNRHNGQSPAKPAANDSEGCVVAYLGNQYAAALWLVRRQLEVHGSSVVSPTFAGKKDILKFRPRP